MPELPEVETTCRGLSTVLEGNKIDTVQKLRAGLRIPFPSYIEKIMSGAFVVSVIRKAKYVCIYLSNGYISIIHLGMSGRIIITSKSNELQKHDHFVIDMSNGDRIVLNDPRRFGLVTLIKDTEIQTHRLFKNIGPEPLSDTFTPELLSSILQNKNISIKLALLDQKNISGIGNIYACEALFRARISPRRKSGSIFGKRATRLVNAIKLVLNEAIEAGGSSLRDYVQPNGELGYFAINWRVYGREGKSCLWNHHKGKDVLVKRITQSGRSTFYCPICQR